MSKPKLFLRCTSTDRRATMINGCLNVGIEHLGNCTGEIRDENGNVVSAHYSSTLGWLRHDLLREIDQDQYDVIDMISQDVFVMALPESGAKDERED